MSILGSRSRFSVLLIECFRFRLSDEWIPMNSARLRPLDSEKKDSPIPSTSQSKAEIQFAEGERCLARWTDSRKFPATIQRVLENSKLSSSIHQAQSITSVLSADTFEVLFEDGFLKVVKGTHISKLRRPASDRAPPPTMPITPIVKKAAKPHPIPKFDISKFNLPEIPSDGEWCCQWVNDTPIGREGYLTNADGNKRPTVLVEDWRLPSGWTKHLYQRSSVSGKWDVVLVGPNNKRFRSKNDVKAYLDEQGLAYNPDVYDFSIHKRRAKDIGVYVYTDDYVPPAVPKPGADYSKIEANLSANLEKSESFPGFSPLDTSALPGLNTSAEGQFDLSMTPSKLSQSTLEEGFIYVGALKVQIIDNLFRCPKEGCNKNFRKENHLQIHVKHYHDELSKQLGACPNMTELAYFRTMGNAIDETAAKSQIPNSQFLEKAMQVDKPLRKSLSGAAEVKVEPDVLSTVASAAPTGSEGLKRKAEAALEAEEIKEKRKITPVDIVAPLDIAEAIKTEPSLQSTSKASAAATHLKKEPVEPKDPTKPQIHRFKIGKISKANKIGRKKAGKGFLKKINRSRKKSEGFLDASSALESPYSQLPDAPRSAPPLARRQRLKFLQQYSADSLAGGLTTPGYVDENGQPIKIVRMRKEEIINCLCLFGEEDGLMIQCDLCLCWQHAGCNGFEKASEIPDKYICFICRNPYLGRESMRYVHDQDWLYEGKLYHADYHKPSPNSPHRFEALKQSHRLTGNLLELKRSLHSLNVKINIAANKDHPKMYLWSRRWEESPPKEVEHAGVTLKKEPTDISTENVTSGTNPSSESAPANIELKSEVSPNGEEEAKDTKEQPAEDIKPVEADLSGNTSENAPNDPASAQPIPNIPEPEAAIDPVECQHRLLEHIQKEQGIMMSRMQAIDAEIVGKFQMSKATRSLRVNFNSI